MSPTVQLIRLPFCSKKIIERNRDFQHLQLFDFLFVFTGFLEVI